MVRSGALLYQQQAGFLAERSAPAAAFPKMCIRDRGCTVVPLAAQQKRLLVADGVEGLVFDPFTPVLDLTYTCLLYTSRCV